MTSVSDSSESSAFQYNALGQVTQETRVMDGRTYLTQYAYDPAAMDLQAVTYPSGLAVTYQRDGDGRISGITADSQAIAGNVSYLPFGPMNGMTLGSVAVTRTFNPRYLMTDITAGSVMNVSYDYDGAGNMKRVNGLPRPPLVPGTTDYTHTANRLVSSSGVSTKNFSYDNMGNITSDGVRTFEYDQSNRVVQVTESGVVRAEYAYDAFNRRVKKIVDGEVTCFHYDANGLLICETDASGNAIRDYVYLNGEPVAMKTAGNWYWFICDHLGTPQKLIDNSGNVVWEAAYLPFGKARILTAEVENNLRFPGQYFDEESGLHYNWNRYYDPELGRYITADPIGLSGGVNLYVYAGNNPIILFDPYGLFTASDIAASWQASAMESSAGLDQMVSDSPGLWAAAATVQTIMDMGGGMVDMLRFGEGFVEGSPSGCGTDVLRGIGLASGLFSAAGKGLQIANQVRAPKSKVNKTADAIEDYLGHGAKPKINEAGDLLIESSDGARKVRFDINDPSPHKSLHGHVEEFKKVKNKMKPKYKSGPIYPKDVPHE